MPKPIVPHTRCLPYPICPFSPEKIRFIVGNISFLFELIYKVVKSFIHPKNLSCIHKYFYILLKYILTNHLPNMSKQIASLMQLETLKPILPRDIKSTNPQKVMDVYRQ